MTVASRGGMGSRRGRSQRRWTEVIQAEHLVLRPARARDVLAIIDYYRRNRRHLAPWDPVRPRSFFTEDHWRRQVRVNARELRQGLSMRLFMFLGERVIGSVSFTNVSRGALQGCWLGYSLDGREQGNGYMTEALRAAIPHAFRVLKLHRIMAGYMPRNRRSARVLRRLGFRVEGRARQYLLIAGRWEDHVLTSLVNPGVAARARRSSSPPRARRARGGVSG